ncbi:nucleoside-diphosphate sugar epimerase [Amycolatopsis deserti]|uniref:Nucleoside-diphosphate sugar epimerase n=1 Tax=Amycolatopsis deserti TaxID=185696 RepID=A0ABQ3IYX8_9PSEU|nr:NAD(P)-dependent oxidoreductase [Amycolatopsis deserti]GHE98701.1 nucleoside-diphosphate sugar epimerase [Amycolatopsis deserti]
MTKVLVTGAAGRVGANVVKRLVGAGVGVRAMVLPGDPQAAKLATLPEVEVAEADLLDQAAIDSACRGVTHVVHLAAQLVRGDTPVDRFYDINAFGTLRLLEGVLRGGGVERFVLASTDGTYRPGDPPAVPLSEDAPQEPADYYGTSKLLGEIILRNHAAQFDIPFAMVRFATVVSPEEAVEQFRLRWVRELLGRAELGRDSNIWQLFRGRPDLWKIIDEQVGGDADDRMAVGLVGPDDVPWTLHLLDVRDAVEGVFRALTEPGALGGVFNIAAARPTSFVAGSEIIADRFGVPCAVVRMPMTWRLEMTIDAARRSLGFAPKYDFASMVATAASAVGNDVIPARVWAGGV